MNISVGRTNFFAFIILLAIAIVGLAACGNESNDKAEAEKVTTSGVDTVAKEGVQEETVREVTHAMGITEITGTPQRVVILTNEGTEALLALGVKPVGAIQSWSGEPWHNHIKDDMEGVKDLGYENEPNLEAIIALNPDLIIGNKIRHEKIYDQLSKIAPTVYSEDLAHWRSNLELYAQALNKEEEAVNALKEFDQRVADAKAKLGDKTATRVSVAKFSKKGVQIYQKDTFSGGLLEQLGMARPASQDVNNFAEFVSEEGVDAMDGDILFYWASDEIGSTEIAEQAKEWFESPVFKSLNVSKINEIHQVDDVIWNTAGGIKAADLLLEDIMKRFE